MAFDLYSIQKNLKTYMETEFPQYVFFRNTVPEDDSLPRQGEEVNPFFVLQYGQMYPRPRGKSVAGARNDDYYSWVQVIGMGSIEDDVANALALPVDRMIGLKLPGTTPFTPDGGSTDYGSRQYSVRPVLYYQSQRFEFGITQNGLDGHLST